MKIQVKFGMCILGLFVTALCLHGQEGLIPAFEVQTDDMTLQRLAQPGTPFDKTGRKFAILGDESGAFEAWAYPLKLLRNFNFSFLVGTSTRPIQGRDIVRTIRVNPEATTLTYTYQSFTVKAVYITPQDQPGAIILLEVVSQVPLTIICGFLPTLQPMWPAGLGGQYAYWDEELKAYVISESSRKNHGLVGSPAASGISYTPAHMLSDAPNEFNIIISDPESVRGKYIPIYMAGGPGQRDKIRAVYKALQNDPEKLYLKNREHFHKLREKTLRIQTPEKNLDLAFEWAKVSYDNLIVQNPNLGMGLVAGLGASGTSGRPGFGWYFGGDAFINTFSLLGYGIHETVRQILAFNRKWQREDGKMAHELTQAEGYVDWWNDYPFGFIHADTTPFFIVAVHDYFRMTGDISFIRESWDSLDKAYRWCLSTDGDGDGLMDNKAAGLGALEYGALTGIQTDIYLAAVWTQAARAMQRLAEAAGKPSLAGQAGAHYQKAQRAFRDRYWDEAESFYVYAFSSDGERVSEISPWCAVGLMWKLGEVERSRKSLQRLCSSDMMTDWGVRSISDKSKFYSPLNYNYGAVWPFVTSWVTAALFKHHLSLQAYTLLTATARHTFTYSLGNLPEVISGSQYIWPQESVSHQGFSTAGVVLPLVRGLFGLEGSAVSKNVVFAPHFPADWKRASAENYRVGEARFSFFYTREKGRLVIRVKGQQAEGYSIRLAPAFGIGTEIDAVSIEGSHDIEYNIKESSQAIQPEIALPFRDKPVTIEIEYTPFVEIIPPHPRPQMGETNKGLKIIALKKTSDGLLLQIEGRAGSSYQLGLFNSSLVQSVEGAVLKEGMLSINIPRDKDNGFVPHQIIIRTE